MIYQIAAVATSGAHSLAALESGEVYSWGKNGYGQLGDGTYQERTRPQIIKDLPGRVLGIATGNLHSLAFLESGEVYSWGWNVHGQLGDGTIQERNHPKVIKAIPGKVVSIATGYHFSLAVLENGKVYGWGRNGYGQLGNGTNRRSSFPLIIGGIPGKVVSIAAGDLHSLALLESGEVYGWGWNRYGMLGNGTDQINASPQVIKGIPGRVVGIAAGHYHSLAFLESGEVYGWGWNGNGQLGDGTTEDKIYPQLNKTIPGKVIGLSAGEYHSLALLKNGKVYGWGRNDEGQLGGGKSQNVLIPSNISIIDKNNLLGLFGKGGKVVGLTELENKFRKFIGKELSL